MSGGLILNVTLLGLGMHPAAWRLTTRSGAAYLDAAFYRDIALTAERGKLHALFLADTLAAGEEAYQRPNLGAMDPVTVLSSLANITQHIGLVATASTTFNDPFNLARRFMTLDHLSNGRAGWNIVTTFVPDVAANFGQQGLPPVAARYQRAEEFVDVVRALWQSWQPGAIVDDKSGGIFADTARIQPVNHHGDHFDVQGPLTLPPSRQQHAVLFQAGASEAGRQLAARNADIVFTAQNTLRSAQHFYQDIKQRARGFGRDHQQIKVLPGLMPIIGTSEAEAHARKAQLDALAGESELKKLALRLGVEVSDLALDKPLPVDKILSNPNFCGAEGFRDAALRLASEENLTVRELLYRNGGGHLQAIGTPAQIADLIEHWYQHQAADGFNLMIDSLPDGLHRFVDSVVPLLQQRGVFHQDYHGTTLRENLGFGVHHD
ncbi:LLM class flavin-dependent oxidoreductase [Erwiniaceae bacterium BAC15a-03b]|uniref:LLM class flavin-dependent oxidoreductase n=1 Tax=Winslowiella arboricola TaxID=2978220 RepID=A0A9J6PN78_9GAMM|nr:LLM class flavin-dependent oxidoreductase [Winslowiella arboricola]MCU5772437.1 LLM class flavin-dependent oxidoreductase [Winslowiella arboricola]MCU5779769.1 LLM class flavin-dependent oxidoreductase [Winslowiella arboricola]